ncbi:MAG: hypothetical protein C5B56_12085 [Proteobacteria bacterium]|nr:MAG: hypothetical protein C5B56_12085 [Pseudomonadota bacterium]
MRSSRHAFLAVMVRLQARAKVARPPRPLKPPCRSRPSASGEGNGGTVIIDAPTSAVPAKAADVALSGSYIASAFGAAVIAIR